MNFYETKINELKDIINKQDDELFKLKLAIGYLLAENAKYRDPIVQSKKLEEIYGPSTFIRQCCQK